MGHKELSILHKFQNKVPFQFHKCSLKILNILLEVKCHVFKFIVTVQRFFNVQLSIFCQFWMSFLKLIYFYYFTSLFHLTSAINFDIFDIFKCNSTTLINS